MQQSSNEPPSWYTHPPKDYQFIYSTAASKTQQSARNIALLSINRSLYSELSDSFSSKNPPIHINSSLELKALQETSAKIANSLVFHGIKTLESTTFRSQNLILISVSRASIFAEQKQKLDAVYTPIKKQLEALYSLDPLKQYALIAPTITLLDEIAARAKLLEIISNGFDGGEYFAFVNSIKDNFKQLQKNIGMRVLGNLNAIRFVRYIQEGIVQQNITVDKTLSEKESYTLFILTAVDKKMDYQFYKTTLTVTTIVATKDKKVIAEKLHTFIGKSRKDYQDAQAQAEESVGKQVKSLGIFNFLGLDNTMKKGKE